MLSRILCLLMIGGILLTSCTGTGTVGPGEESSRQNAGTGSGTGSPDGIGNAGDPGGTDDPVSRHMSDYLAEVLNLEERYGRSAVADQLNMGDEASGNAHGLTLSGSAARTRVVAETGTRSDPYDVVRFCAKGDRAVFRFDLSEPIPQNADERILFEVEEIHENTEQGFAYAITVNGSVVYFRSYEQIASAPNHFFFSIARSSVRDLSSVEIGIISDQNAVFMISSIRAYTDFSTLAAEEEIYSNLGVNLYSVKSVETAQEQLARYTGRYSYDLFDVGLMFRVDYMNQSVADTVNEMVNYLNVANNWGVPVQIMNSMYWSGTAYGPDGEGGSFTDPKYSQVLYNSKTGEYYRSTPNVYSNTNWATSGNDTLNRAATEKLEEIFAAYAEKAAAASLNGADPTQMTYVMEWGICYKGIGTMTGIGKNGNPLDGGDFNPALVVKAAADGVALDPTDGLSYAEKEWLTNWTAKYNQAIADAYHSGFSTDAVLVNNGEITLPTAQSMDRIFSHNVQWINQNPSRGDLRISGWKSGVGTGFYSSSEDMYFDDVRFYQYKTAYGRTGCVNLEMAIHGSSEIIARYLRQSYLLGLESVTLFNDQESYGTAATLKALDTMDRMSADAPTEYRRNLVNVDFMRDLADPALVQHTPAIVEVSNMAQDAVNGLLAMQKGGTGTVTFRVSDDGRAFTNGLTLALQAAEIYGDTIRIWVGDSLSDLSLYKIFQPTAQVDRFNTNYLCTYDLTGLTRGKTETYIRIECVSSGKTAGVQFVKVYLNNSMATGQTDGNLPTLREERTRNLYVSARAIALNACDAYLAKNGGSDAVSEAAMELIEKGYVTTAYRLLSGQISEVLPATYQVKKTGTLGRYPVSVTPSRGSVAVTVTLTSYGAESGITFTAKSERQQTMDVTLFDLADGTRWIAEGSDDVRTIRPARSDETEGVQIAENGAVTFAVTVGPEASPTYTAVEGRAYADLNGSTLRVTVQDRAISDSAEYVSFTIDAGCQYIRHADGSTATVTGSAAAPRRNDYVRLTFNEAGTKVVAVESVWGEKTGVVQRFIAPDARTGTNGTIVFADGTAFDLEYQRYTTRIVIGGTDAYARGLYPSEMATLIRAGMTLTVTYCPETYNGANPRLLTVTQ